jgi:hypothetical protein
MCPEAFQAELLLTTKAELRLSDQEGQRKRGQVKKKKE